MYKLNFIDKTSFVLVILGALNWGLVGLANLDLISLLFGTPVSLAGRLIYITIGVAGLNTLLFIFRTLKVYSFKKK